MTGRVDFYVLNSADDRQRLQVACRLTEKAYLRGLRVLILSEAPEQANALDEMLWTFSQRAFIPHEQCAAAGESAAPVVIACENVKFAPDLLVNLASSAPQLPGSCARIAEIIDADEQRRRLGRERFKLYRDLKWTLETHQLGANAEV